MTKDEKITHLLMTGALRAARYFAYQTQHRGYPRKKEVENTIAQLDEAIKEAEKLGVKKP